MEPIRHTGERAKLAINLRGDFMAQRGIREAANMVVKAIEKTIQDKTITYDLERQMGGAKLLKCSEFGDAIIANMDKV